jgi:hypothetical protein
MNIRSHSETTHFETRRAAKPGALPSARKIIDAPD